LVQGRHLPHFDLQHTGQHKLEHKTLRERHFHLDHSLYISEKLTENIGQIDIVLSLLFNEKGAVATKKTQQK